MVQHIGSINNSYGENLNNITLNKNNALKDLDDQLNSTNLTFASKEQELLGDIAAKRLELSQNNSARYQQAYQQAVDNYMKFKDYEAQITSLYQTQEQIDQQYKKMQQDYDLALKNYNLALENARRSSSNSVNYEDLINKLLSSSNSTKSSVPAYNPRSSNKVINNKNSGRNPLIGVGIRDAVNFNKAIGRW